MSMHSPLPSPSLVGSLHGHMGESESESESESGSEHESNHLTHYTIHHAPSTYSNQPPSPSHVARLPALQPADSLDLRVAAGMERLIHMQHNNTFHANTPTANASSAAAAGGVSRLSRPPSPSLVRAASPSPSPSSSSLSRQASDLVSPRVLSRGASINMSPMSSPRMNGSVPAALRIADTSAAIVQPADPPIHLPSNDSTSARTLAWPSQQLTNAEAAHLLHEAIFNIQHVPASFRNRPPTFIPLKLNLANNALQGACDDFLGELVAHTIPLLTVDLERNGINDITILARLSHRLTHLNVASNSISSLPTSFFAYLPSVASINLSFNQLVSLEGCELRQCRLLRTLELDGNRLEALPSDLARHPSLTHLSVTGNALNDADFTMNLLASIPGLTSLVLADNPAFGDMANVLRARGNFKQCLPHLTVLEGKDLDGPTVTFGQLTIATAPTEHAEVGVTGMKRAPSPSNSVGRSVGVRRSRPSSPVKSNSRPSSPAPARFMSDRRPPSPAPAPAPAPRRATRTASMAQHPASAPTSRAGSRRSSIDRQTAMQLKHEASPISRPASALSAPSQSLQSSQPLDADTPLTQPATPTPATPRSQADPLTLEMTRELLELNQQLLHTTNELTLSESRRLQLRMAQQATLQTNAQEQIQSSPPLPSQSPNSQASTGHALQEMKNILLDRAQRRRTASGNAAPLITSMLQPKSDALLATQDALVLAPAAPSAQPASSPPVAPSFPSLVDAIDSIVSHAPVNTGLTVQTSPVDANSEPLSARARKSPLQLLSESEEFNTSPTAHNHHATPHTETQASSNDANNAQSDAAASTAASNRKPRRSLSQSRLEQHKSAALPPMIAALMPSTPTVPPHAAGFKRPSELLSPDSVAGSMDMTSIATTVSSQSHSPSSRTTNHSLDAELDAALHDDETNSHNNLSISSQHIHHTMDSMHAQTVPATTTSTSASTRATASTADTLSPTELKAEVMLQRRKMQSLLARFQQQKQVLAEHENMIVELRRLTHWREGLDRMTAWMNKRARPLARTAFHKWNQHYGAALAQRRQRALQNVCKMAEIRRQLLLQSSLRRSFSHWCRMSMALSVVSVKSSWMGDWERDVQCEQRTRALHIIAHATSQQRLQRVLRRQVLASWLLYARTHARQERVNLERREVSQEQQTLIGLVLQHRTSIEQLEQRAADERVQAQLVSSEKDTRIASLEKEMRTYQHLLKTMDQQMDAAATTHQHSVAVFLKRLHACVRMVEVQNAAELRCLSRVWCCWNLRSMGAEGALLQQAREMGPLSLLRGFIGLAVQVENSSMREPATPARPHPFLSPAFLHTLRQSVGKPHTPASTSTNNDATSGSLSSLGHMMRIEELDAAANEQNEADEAATPIAGADPFHVASTSTDIEAEAHSPPPVRAEAETSSVSPPLPKLAPAPPPVARLSPRTYEAHPFPSSLAEPSLHHMAHQPTFGTPAASVPSAVPMPHSRANTSQSASTNLDSLDEELRKAQAARRMVTILRSYISIKLEAETAEIARKIAEARARSIHYTPAHTQHAHATPVAHSHFHVTSQLVTPQQPPPMRFMNGTHTASHPTPQAPAPAMLYRMPASYSSQSQR